LAADIVVLKDDCRDERNWIPEITDFTGGENVPLPISDFQTTE
jgi:hypothetical protein